MNRSAKASPKTLTGSRASSDPTDSPRRPPEYREVTQPTADRVREPGRPPSATVRCPVPCSDGHPDMRCQRTTRRARADRRGHRPRSAATPRHPPAARARNWARMRVGALRQESDGDPPTHLRHGDQDGPRGRGRAGRSSSPTSSWRSSQGAAADRDAGGRIGGAEAILEMLSCREAPSKDTGAANPGEDRHPPLSDARSRRVVSPKVRHLEAGAEHVAQ
jgi:hypothetical protein